MGFYTLVLPRWLAKHHVRKQMTFQIFSLYQQGVARQCRVVRWHDHVPRVLRAHDEGADGVGSIHDKGQGRPHQTETS